MKINSILTGLVNVVVGVAWTLLGLRFLLRLFSANTENGFVSWVYDTSGEILGPFRGIFPDTNLEGFVFDFTALFAILVYGLFGMLVIFLIDALTPTKTVKKR